MLVQCPACKKINSDPGLCERCGCDLWPLGEILRAAEFELQIGTEKLKKGAGDQALGHAKKSWFLRKSDAAAKLAFLACMFSGEFKEARVWYDGAASFHS